MRRLHPMAGMLALLTIAAFLTATLVSEIIGSPALIRSVKMAIPWGLFWLIPALALTGISGMKRAGARRGGLIGTKIARMRIIAANGLLVLVPSALFLAARAGAGNFDTAFYVVQGVELAAGGLNVTLLMLSARDGLRLTRRKRSPTTST